MPLALLISYQLPRPLELVLFIAFGSFFGAWALHRVSRVTSFFVSGLQAAAAGKPALSGFTCAKSGNALLMTSGQAGEFSTVRVLPGPVNDCSARLKLGFEETDAVGAIRPKETPAPGTLTSGALSAGDMNSFPDATHTSFLIALDGGRPEEVFVGAAAFTGGTAAVKIGKAAEAIQAAVRALKPLPAFTKFTCTLSGNQLVLASGTRGEGSAVAVLPDL